jgi:hypothetical protein
MEYQNVTLSLPLKELVEKEDAYRKARERHLAALDTLVLGTQGNPRWSRSELHARGG